MVLEDEEAESPTPGEASTRASRGQQSAGWQVDTEPRAASSLDSRLTSRPRSRSPQLEAAPAESGDPLCSLATCPSFSRLPADFWLPGGGPLAHSAQTPIPVTGTRSLQVAEWS